MKKQRKIFLLAFIVCLSSCSEKLKQLENIGKEPVMQKVEVPMEKLSYEPLDWQPEEDPLPPKYANSLWQQGSRAFFKDLKARRVGDILRVTVRIQDRAELENQTIQNRINNESANAPSLFGLENKLLNLIPGAGNPASLLNIGSTGNNTGIGTVEREEIIETEIAAMVTQILPNGNLVIHGDQEIRVNFELRKVTVDGIVRQEDISADNSITSNQIAEARISYGGKGQLTNIQQPRYGTQILDILSPF